MGAYSWEEAAEIYQRQFKLVYQVCVWPMNCFISIQDINPSVISNVRAHGGQSRSSS